MESQSEQSTSAPMEDPLKKTEVEKLASEVEKLSDEYFNELQSKIFGLRQKLDEETLVNGQLQNRVHTLQGQIQVWHLRTEALGLEEISKAFDQAKEELESETREQMTRTMDILNKGKEILFDAGHSTTQYFEDQRHEFTTQTSIVESAELELRHYEQLLANFNETEGKIKRVELSVQDCIDFGKTFTNIDPVLKNYLRAIQDVEAEIGDWSMKLHARSCTYRNLAGP